MKQVDVDGRLQVPNYLSEPNFNIQMVRVQQNNEIVDGLEIALGLVSAKTPDQTLAALFLDRQSARKLAEAILSVVNQEPLGQT